MLDRTIQLPMDGEDGGGAAGGPLSKAELNPVERWCCQGQHLRQGLAIGSSQGDSPIELQTKRSIGTCRWESRAKRLLPSLSHALQTTKRV